MNPFRSQRSPVPKPGGERTARGFWVLVCNIKPHSQRDEAWQAATVMFLQGEALGQGYSEFAGTAIHSPVQINRERERERERE